MTATFVSFFQPLTPGLQKVYWHVAFERTCLSESKLDITSAILIIRGKVERTVSTPDSIAEMDDAA